MFDYHRKQGYTDLYSLHSWCGMLVSVLYFVQVSPSSPTATCHRRALLQAVPIGERAASVQLDAAFRLEMCTKPGFHRGRGLGSWCPSAAMHMCLATGLAFHLYKYDEPDLA